jgi:hypothetical protein
MRLGHVAIAVVLLGGCSAGYAETISAGSVSTITLSPASDTLSFGASDETVPVSGTFTQTGTFYIGDSEIPNQTIAFTFTDDVTLDGVSKSLVFHGQDVVTTGPDTLTIDALGPVDFGDVVLNFDSLTVEGAGVVGQSLPVTLDANVVGPTPEPSSMALLGTGMLGMAGVWRRRRG